MSKEPNFEAFEDWLVREPAGRWLHPFELDKELNAQQKSIVEKNAKLLLDRAAWRAHVQAFEEQLALIKDEDERSQTRAMFEIRFDRHTFPDHQANFSRFPFPCSVSFDRVTFGEGAVWLNGATFADGNISFRLATFGDGHVSLIGSTFSGGAVSFNGSTFGDGYVLFQNIKLAETSIYFEDIDVGGNFFVRDIIFRKEANFQRASVKGTADFSGNTFHEVPNFLDTNFARPPEVAGMEVPPPEMKVNKALKVAKNIPAYNIAKYKEDAAKYRQLKKMALAANDHEKGGEFFAYEMRAKRGREKGSIEWYELLANWLYFKLSDFGQSYLRPLVCLGISLAAFIVPYAWMVCSFLKKSDAFYFALAHSWRNFTPLTNSLFRFSTRPEDHPSGYDKIFHDLAHDDGPVDLLINIGIFQNFIGLILLFLLLLGLRNKFRLK